MQNNSMDAVVVLLAGNRGLVGDELATAPMETIGNFTTSPMKTDCEVLATMKHSIFQKTYGFDEFFMKAHAVRGGGRETQLHPWEWLGANQYAPKAMQGGSCPTVCDHQNLSYLIVVVHRRATSGIGF